MRRLNQNLLAIVVVGSRLTVLAAAFSAGHAPPSPFPPQSSRNAFGVQSTASLFMTTDTSVAIEEESVVTADTSIHDDDDEVFLDDVNRWKQDAQRMRLEAAQLDMALTLRKIKAIERKLGASSNSKRLAIKPDEREQLERQLKALQVKLHQTMTDPSSSSSTGSVTSRMATPAQANDHYVSTEAQQILEKSLEEEEQVVSEIVPPKSRTGSSSLKLKTMTPLYGFDEADLEIYFPVARRIEEAMLNATIHERLAAFRADPLLRAHFDSKIRQAVVEPMEDIQRLDDLKKRYLVSSSSVEKNQLKREIDQLEKTIEDEGVYTYSETVCLNLPPMTADDLQARIKAIGSLPVTLQALYKRAQNIDVDEALELAIMMDYYEQQMQLLEQVQEYAPLNKAFVDETRAAIETLPHILRDYLAQKSGLAKGSSVETIVKVLEKGGFEGGDAAWTKLQNAVFESATGKSLPDLPEYTDIDFIDRSRYVEELYPHVARMEGQHPSLEQVNAFVGKLGRRSFMVTSKPERVLGGWYIRGENQISDDESGVKLMAKVEESLGVEMKDQLEYFFIEDPSPMDDELIEMGYDDQQIFLVTSKNQTVFYSHAGPLVNALVSLLGLAATLVFGIVATEFQPAIHNQIDAALAKGGDLFSVLGPALSIAASSLAVQTAHEIAHKAIARRDNFTIGSPTLLPSVNLGLLGAITPIESPPPSLKSLFDFAIAGPLAGFVVSIVLLMHGLAITASAGVDQVAQLPALPTALLRSSALGGGLVELFLGRGTLHATTGTDTILPLYPSAIAGFVGIMSSALALLPLGNTDGGRISVALFGRHVAFVVNAFTLALLCLVGVFGADGSDVLLVYSLFCVIWQRDLESPARNEVEEVDLLRSGLAFVAALAVVLSLAPLPV